LVSLHQPPKNTLEFGVKNLVFIKTITVSFAISKILR
jgi:hypothetical protein